VLGVRHEVFDRDASLATERRKNRMTGYCCVEHAWLLPVCDYLCAHVEFAFDGLAGDVLSAGHFLDEEILDQFRRADIDALAKRLVFKHEAFLESFLARRLYKMLGPAVAVERLSRELRRHFDAPNPVLSFYFWNRTRRAAALSPYAMHPGLRAVFAPYLDHAVFDFLASLPPEMMLDHSFHTEAIARAHPHVADIPYASKHKMAVLAGYRANAGELLSQLTRHRIPFIRRPFAAARLLRCEIDRAYSPMMSWFGPLLTYFIDLAATGATPEL
jgi:hypothetical protein